MTKGCDNCEYSGRPSYAYPCYVCIGKNKWEAKAKPKTNADNIRRMTDEELAKWLCSKFDCYGNKPCPVKDICYPDHNGMLYWLQQPYKENEDVR